VLSGSLSISGVLFRWAATKLAQAASAAQGLVKGELARLAARGRQAALHFGGASSRHVSGHDSSWLT
jgi:hypothetical protein